MRLPERSELHSGGAEHLYRHDLIEWHNPNRLRRVDYRYRINRVISLVRQHASGKRCLEVGCAQANLTLLLAEQGFQTTGMDLDAEFVEYARRKYVRGDANFIVSSGDHLPFDHACFDILLLTELLEHVAYPEDFLLEVSRTLKSRGIVVVTTPNGAHHQSQLPTFADICSDRTAIVPRQFGPDAGDHLFLFTLEELETLIELAGYEVLHSEEFFVDLTRRIVGKLCSYGIWQGPFVILTRPLAFVVSWFDILVRRLHLVDSRTSAQALLLVAVRR